MSDINGINSGVDNKKKFQPFSGQGQSIDGKTTNGSTNVFGSSNAQPQQNMGITGAQGGMNGVAGILSTGQALAASSGLPQIALAMSALSGGAGALGALQRRKTHYSYGNMASEQDIGSNYTAWTKQSGLFNSIASLFTDYDAD